MILSFEESISQSVGFSVSFERRLYGRLRIQGHDAAELLLLIALKPDLGK